MFSFTTNPLITINFSGQDYREKKPFRIPHGEDGNRQYGGHKVELLVYGGQEVGTNFAIFSKVLSSDTIYNLQNVCRVWWVLWMYLFPLVRRLSIWELRSSWSVKQVKKYNRYKFL